MRGVVKGWCVQPSHLHSCNSSFLRGQVCQADCPSPSKRGGEKGKGRYRPYSTGMGCEVFTKEAPVLEGLLAVEPLARHCRQLCSCCSTCLLGLKAVLHAHA